MSHILLRLTLEDYARWKPVFDEYSNLRKDYGSGGGQLLRNTGNPNEVVIFFDWPDHEKGRQYFQSDDVLRAMKQAGVSGRDLYFLEEVEKLSA